MRIEGETGPELHRAEDASAATKAIFFLPQQLNNWNFYGFPLGNLPKSDTRAHAIRFDLPVAEKPDSQDICFGMNGSYANIVENCGQEL